MSDQPKKQPSQPSQEEIMLQQRDAFHALQVECEACQEEIDLHWQYCAHCGVRLATRCPGCGNPLPPAGAPSCPSCGLAIPKVNG